MSLIVDNFWSALTLRNMLTTTANQCKRSAANRLTSNNCCHKLTAYYYKPKLWVLQWIMEKAVIWSDFWSGLNMPKNLFVDIRLTIQLLISAAFFLVFVCPFPSKKKTSCPLRASGLVNILYRFANILKYRYWISQKSSIKISESNTNSNIG